MPELGDPSLVVSGLVKQLCRSKASIPSELLRFKRDSLRPSFEGLQNILTSLACSYSQTFIIIDALDECPIDKRHAIIGLLDEFVSSVSCAKVFITSRKESDIAEAFARQEIPIVEIKADDVAADVGRYVNDEVRRLRKGYNGRQLYIKSNALEEKIIRTLTEKAEGM